jgi:hypothetical protein
METSVRTHTHLSNQLQATIGQSMSMLVIPMLNACRDQVTNFKNVLEPLGSPQMTQDPFQKECHVTLRRRELAVNDRIPQVSPVLIVTMKTLNSVTTFRTGALELLHLLLQRKRHAPVMLAVVMARAVAKLFNQTEPKCV